MDGPGVVLEMLFVATLAVLLCRWVFGTRGIRKVRDRPDYGLLTPVLRTDDEASALAACEQLAAFGIRATVAPAGLGFTAQGRPWPPTAQVVLVFPPDVEAAEAVVRPEQPSPS